MNAPMDAESVKFVLNYVEATAKRDPVPCNGCKACCQGNQSVALMSQFGDDERLYAPEHLRLEKVRPNPDYQVVLARKTNGDCIFLGKRGCTIYDKRPAVCRGFDCRRVCLTMSPQEKKDAIKRRVFPAPVFKAAEERAYSMKLSPEEAFMLGKWGGFIDKVGL